MKKLLAVISIVTSTLLVGCSTPNTSSLTRSDIDTCYAISNEIDSMSEFSDYLMTVPYVVKKENGKNSCMMISLRRARQSEYLTMNVTHAGAADDFELEKISEFVSRRLSFYRLGVKREERFDRYIDTIEEITQKEGYPDYQFLSVSNNFDEETGEINQILMVAVPKATITIELFYGYHKYSVSRHQ